MAEILKLQIDLEDAQNEITILKKVVGHNLGGREAHVKVKEPDSYDGTRSAKTHGNFLWDMEQYLERLGMSNEETKVKVAAKFFTKDAKMWWRRKIDQIANGNAVEITSWDEMKKALQTHFSP